MQGCLCSQTEELKCVLDQRRRVVSRQECQEQFGPKPFPGLNGLQNWWEVHVSGIGLTVNVPRPRCILRLVCRQRFATRWPLIAVNRMLCVFRSWCHPPIPGGLPWQRFAFVDWTGMLPRPKGPVRRTGWSRNWWYPPIHRVSTLAREHPTFKTKLLVRHLLGGRLSPLWEISTWCRKTVRKTGLGHKRGEQHSPTVEIAQRWFSWQGQTTPPITVPTTNFVPWRAD